MHETNSKKNSFHGELAFGGDWWARKLKVMWKKNKSGIRNSGGCWQF